MPVGRLYHATSSLRNTLPPSRVGAGLGDHGKQHDARHKHSVTRAKEWSAERTPAKTKDGRRNPHGREYGRVVAAVNAVGTPCVWVGRAAASVATPKPVIGGLVAH